MVLSGPGTEADAPIPIYTKPADFWSVPLPLTQFLRRYPGDRHGPCAEQEQSKHSSARPHRVPHGRSHTQDPGHDSHSTAGICHPPQPGPKLTSRAFSCPTSPAPAGLAAPLSSSPSPLTWLWAAMRWVFEVLFTSSIFMAGHGGTAAAPARPPRAPRTRPARYRGSQRAPARPAPAPPLAPATALSALIGRGACPSATGAQGFRVRPPVSACGVRGRSGRARALRRSRAGKEGGGGLAVPGVAQENAGQGTGFGARVRFRTWRPLMAWTL